MCGRFSLTSPKQALRDLFPLFDLPNPGAPPRYNVAPTQAVLAVRLPAETGKGEAVALRWGLVPHWADDPAIGNRMINARSETVAEKPVFRDAFRRRRCLVLADGFFEWEKVGRLRQPHYFRLWDAAPFAFAGLWEHWERDGRVIESCSVLTTEANQLVRPFHERMPVILAPADFARWLDPNDRGGEEVRALLRPFPAEAMTTFPVSPRVNAPKHDDAACVLPLAG
jgi:putative SOS response-associated peptidase YedK